MSGPKAERHANKTPQKLYPDFQLPPPQAATTKDEEMLQISRKFRARVRASPYFVRSAEQKQDIQRYSDKYTLSRSKKFDVIKATPTELLQPKLKKKVKIAKTAISLDRLLDIASKTSELEKKEEEGEETEKKEGEEEGEGEGEEEVEYMDDEEETDYNNTYFDDGEDFAQDDDGDEGATF